MRRKKLLKITLCAVLTIGALLFCVQDASARETLLISGNADLYPIESYDSRSDSYVGLLPELYRRVSECTDYDLVYLPYSKNTTQAQQAENRQADIISAFPAGTVDSAYLRRSELFCSLPASGKPQNICIGFASALPEAQAEEIARALDDIGAAERLGILAVSVKDGGASLYRTRWLVTLAALGVMMLGAGVALGVLVRKKRAELKANALIDPRYGIGNDEYYLNCMETRIPAPLRSIVYVICIGCDMPSLERRFGETEREEIFSRAAEYLRLGCGREEYLACVGRGMFALVCQCGSMSKAVEKGEFEPHLQFVVDRAGTVVGAEAVSRWQNPEEGLLKPSKYIDLMVRAGTITELDLYMLRCACVQLQTWKREGRGTLWLSCNFTRQSIADEKILARVREIVEQYDFTRDRLVVELTEDSYAHDREAALRTIEGLHAMGLRIVLDDIGAGYSSLSDLSTYPIDGVKIDRSIVIESALPRARALLEGMIRLSHDMGIRVLCEGVEDKATCDAVLAAGCDFIQGFYFSRVLPGREAESFLRSLAARDREEG